MTPQDLRNSILERAIQGLLVASVGNSDSSVDEFIQGIIDEKEKLINAKVIRKEKNISIDEDYPYEIPDNWRLVRLGDLVYSMSGLSYKKDVLSIKETTMITVLRGGNIGDLSYSFKEDDIFIGKSFVKKDLLLRKNTLITPAVTSLEHIGKLARIEKDYDNVVVGGFVLMLIPYISNDIFSQYLLYALSSSYHRNKCRSITNKSGQAFYNLSREKMMNVAIPVPPIDIQKKIVAKIKELLPWIEQYGEFYESLKLLNAGFPENMKKSILQYAMQGKLVEQRVEEGTAEELYRQIRREKAELIKSGEIKKEKPLPEIKEDEIPFDIPDSWKWIRLGEIIHIESGKGLTAKDMNNGNIPVYGGNGVTGYHDESLVHEETVVIGRVGFYCGSVHVTPKEAWVTDNAFITTYPKKSIDRRFLVYMLRRMNLGQNNNATAQPVVSGKKIYPKLFALPPLEEQRRIAAKIEELLPYCERLGK